jgi:hypothetical protein
MMAWESTSTERQSLMLQARGNTVILPLFIVELNSAAACGLHTVLHTPRAKAARARLSALR